MAVKKEVKAVDIIRKLPFIRIRNREFFFLINDWKKVNFSPYFYKVKIFF